MPSFDIVSELNLMEVENAFNQARKELAQRFDFKGTSTDLERQPDGAVLVKANSEGRAEAEVRAEALRAVEELTPQARANVAEVQEAVRLAVRRVFRKEGAKKPSVLPIVLEL